MRHYNEVPEELEKIFSALHAYREPGTTGYYGDGDCMTIQFKDGWSVTMYQEGAVVKVQLWHNREKDGDLETFGVEDHAELQNFLYLRGI